MNQRSDIDRVLGLWMADGPTVMPDRVVDVVAGRIARQRQRPAWRVSWRDTRVNAYFKRLAAAAAVVVIIAVAGYAVLRPSGPNIGGQATPTPAPSVTPSAPASTACVPAPPEGCGVGPLAAGSHTSRSFRPTFNYTVPAGWQNSQDWPEYFALYPDTPADVSVVIFPDATADALGICSGTVVVGSVAQTATDIAEALAASNSLTTTEPLSVTISGLSGKQLDVQLGPGWNGTCPDWSDQSTDFQDIRQRVIVLDMPSSGNIVILIQAFHSADIGVLLEAATPIVESFELDFGPAAS